MPDDRIELRKRIAKRFDIMLKQGFIEEVEVLYNRGDMHAEMPSIGPSVTDRYGRIWRVNTIMTR